MSRRLCLIVTSAVTATTFLRGYLGFLQNEGWEVTLLCKDDGSVGSFAAQEGVAFESVPIERKPSPVRDAVALVATYRVLKRLRPDVVVYATPKASLLGSLAGVMAGVRVRVYELWGLRLETSRGLSRRVLTVLERLTVRLSTYCIANSQSLAERARELRVTGGKQLVVLGAGSSHGVDAEHFSNGAARARLAPEIALSLGEDPAPVVGYVGRLHPDKGIDTLIDALELIADQGVNFQLLIVGEDEGALIRDRLARLRQRAHVHVTGYLKDVRPAIAQMDVLVLPSRREGFPNVVLEAASLQVPAVVSDATGARDAVVPGITGRIARVGNPASFSEEITVLMTDAKLRRQMGVDARRHVLANFRPEDVWKKHSDSWFSALTSVRSAHASS